MKEVNCNPQTVIMILIVTIPILMLKNLVLACHSEAIITGGAGIDLEREKGRGQTITEEAEGAVSGSFLTHLFICLCYILCLFVR